MPLPFFAHYTLEYVLDVDPVPEALWHMLARECTLLPASNNDALLEGRLAELLVQPSLRLGEGIGP